MSLYIDIHTHKKIITDSNIFALIDLSDSIDNIPQTKHVSIGIHPWHIDNINITDKLHTISQLAKNQNVLAIGETGLDKKCTTNFELQRKTFLSLIEISEQLNKPLIIHCVLSYNEILQIRKTSKSRQKWLIHGYNGNKELAEQLIKANIFLSFGKLLSDSNTRAYKSFAKIPKEYMFLETDNSHHDIRQIYEFASPILNLSSTEIIAQFQQNLAKFIN